MKNTDEYHHDDEDEYDMHTMVNDKYASDRLPGEISDDALADMFSTNGDNNEDAPGTDGHDIEEIADDIDGRNEARDTEGHSRTDENKHDSEGHIDNEDMHIEDMHNDISTTHRDKKKRNDVRLHACASEEAQDCRHHW